MTSLEYKVMITMKDGTCYCLSLTEAQAEYLKKQSIEEKKLPCKISFKNSFLYFRWKNVDVMTIEKESSES